MVRRKELKEKLNKNSQSDKDNDTTAKVTGISIGEKRKIESNPQVKQDGPDKKISKNENKQYTLEPGSVMSVSTETDLLNKDIIRVCILMFIHLIPFIFNIHTILLLFYVLNVLYIIFENILIHKNTYKRWKSYFLE